MKKIFKIRAADKTDVPDILNFIKQLAEKNKSLNKLVVTEELLSKYLFGSKIYAEVILGCIDQEPVSYAMFCYNFSTLYGKPALYLIDLFVLPEFRHQGIAQNLMSHLAALAIKQDFCRIDLSVLESNLIATQFYNKIGAKKLAEWRIYRLEGNALNSLLNNNNE